MTDRRNLRRLAVAVGLVVAVWGIAFVAKHDPGAAGGPYPPCPVRALTGLRCPGCGTLTATHAILHGDLGGAWAANPFAVLALPWMVWALAALAAYALRGGWLRPPLGTLLPVRWRAPLALTGLALYMIGRNL